MIIKRGEMDRPTFNSLKYITTVRPHYITKDPWLVDHYVEDSLTELLGRDPIEEFGQYTRSFYTLEGHYHNLWNYDRPITGPPNDPILLIAIEYVREQYRLPQPVNSISWYNLSSVPYIPSSSAGWGYVGKKGDAGNHKKAIGRAVSSLYWWLGDSQSPSAPFRYRPDLAWTRTQLSVPGSPKIRHVWGEAFENIILEGMSAAPLIEAYREIQSPMVVGTQLFRRVPAIIHEVLGTQDHPNIGVGLDLKSFDSSVQPWLINVAFDIIRENLIFNNIMEEYAFDYTQYFFTNRPVVMPDGRMWMKRVGVPSGSYYTQLVDSIANSIVTAFAQLKVYGEVFKTYVLGDDSLFGVPRTFGYPNLEELATVFRSVGMELSTQKCVISQRPEELEFLGHCARGLKMTRDEAELIRLALYPEFPVIGPAMSMSRVSGLLLDSALTSWHILHLYKYMRAKYREIFTAEDPTFTHDDKNWLIAVIGFVTRPNLIDEIKVFTVT